MTIIADDRFAFCPALCYNGSQYGMAVERGEEMEQKIRRDRNMGGNLRRLRGYGDLVTVAPPRGCYTVFISNARRLFAMGAAVRRRRRASVDQGSCVACGCCVRVCPLSAIQVVKGITAQVDKERCVGCGKCAKECPASVITIEEATA